MVAAFGAVVMLGIANTPNAFGAIAKEVNAEASSTFKIDPSRDFEQYYGDVDYTKVTPEDPKDAKVPKAMGDDARDACEEYFVEGEENGLYTGFRIFYDGGTNLNVSIFQDEFSVVTAGGKWISRAFNGDSGEEVVAKGLFWDSVYNFQRNQESTTFRYDGKRVHVNCDAELNLKREYP